MDAIKKERRANRRGAHKPVKWTEGDRTVCFLARIDAFGNPEDCHDCC